MEDNYLEERQYLKAKKRVKEIKGFYIQFFLYVFITPIIITTNLVFSPSYHWFWFSTIGWAIGVFFHWMAVFGFRKLGFGDHWEEKKIQEIMQEQKNRKEIR